MPQPTPPPSVNVEQLAGWLGNRKPLRMLDVRRPPAFEKHPNVIAGAQRVLPDEIQEWIRKNEAGLPVIAYCVHGHEVSQGAVAALLAHGFEAVFLEGGISEWRDHGHPTVAWDAPPQAPAK